jgi:hypothetical protein
VGQQTVGPVGFDQQLEGQVIGIQPGRAMCHKDAQRVLADQVMEFIEPLLGKMCGDVHGVFLGGDG